MKEIDACCLQTGSPLNEPERTRFLEIARAMANPTRLLILEYLKVQSCCITGTMVDLLPLAQSTVSVHLKVLKEAGLIRGSIEGTATNYCTNPETIAWFKEKLNMIL